MEIKVSNSVSLVYEKWEAKEAKASLLIIHGMAEHIMRYKHFSEYLSLNGITVYGYDQRGHGQNVKEISELGYLGELGWQSVVDDVDLMVDMIKSENELPLFIMGHSMGSFVVRDYLSLHSNRLAGAIISGTGGPSGFLGGVLTTLAKIQVIFKGDQYQSKLIDKLTNNEFNKGIKPLRTSCDWLSCDDKEVDKYVTDPYCGTVFTASFYRDLFQAVERVNKMPAVVDLEGNLSIYLFSGSKDPVGSFGKGVKSTYALMKKANLEDVEMKLYPSGRHEMINELNKEEVYKDVLEWVNERV